jgi:hypothetical protein
MGLPNLLRNQHDLGHVVFSQPIYQLSHRVMVKIVVHSQILKKGVLVLSILHARTRTCARQCRWKAEAASGSRAQGGGTAAVPMPRPANDETGTVEARLPASLNYQGKARIFQVGPGSVIGEMDWVLRRARTFQCLAVSKATVLCLSRTAHERMAQSHPHANSMLLQMLLRSSMLSTAHAMHALEQAVR